MIDTIPNPLNDKGVQRDIEDKVQELLTWQGNHHNITEQIKLLITQAANWGMSEGFRLGWRVYENTKGGKI